MDKFTIDCLREIAVAAQSIEKAVGKIVGWTVGNGKYPANADCPTAPPTPLPSMNGYDNQRNILEEIKAMIVDLSIKASVRERPDGRFELRSRLLGSIYGFSKEEIELKLTKKLKEVQKNKGKPLSKKKEVPLMSEFFTKQYLPYKQQSLAESSLYEIERDFKLIMKGKFDKRLDKYTTASIEMYLFSIPQTRTRQIIRGLINNILSYAKRLGLIKENPCDNVEKVKHVQQIGEALSFEEQLQFFDNLFADPTIENPHKLYFAFLYLTGTRRNEAISVTSKDVDYRNNTLHIRGTKTKGSDRTLPLFPLVRQILLAITPDKSGVFFPATGNRVDGIMRRVKGNDHHPHELRHTFGTIKMCIERLDPKTVSLYMGHTTTQMTLSRYTHPEQLDKGVFYNGSLSEEVKLARLKEQYAAVLERISSFIKNLP